MKQRPTPTPLLLYIGLVVSKLADRNAAIVSWDSSVKQEAPSHVFTRQAIAMNWDFAEANIFGNSTGNWTDSVRRTSLPVEALGVGPLGEATRAQLTGCRFVAFFCLPIRPTTTTLATRFVRLFCVATPRTPQHPPRVALAPCWFPRPRSLLPIRTGTAARMAHMSFSRRVFGKYSRARESALPVSRSPSTTPSSSLRPSRVMKPQPAGRPYLRDDHLRMVGDRNPPLRERVGQSDAVAGTNALASSILLALRPRPDNAPRTDRRRFIATLKAECRPH